MKKILCVSLANLLAGTAAAQAPFPGRPVSMLVGFAPGGGTDTASRIIAKKLSENLGQANSSSWRPPSPAPSRTAPPASAGVHVNWYAFVASGKTPRDIIARWNQELVKVLNAPDVREQLHPHGFEAHPGTPEALTKYMQREYAIWGKVVKEANITAN